MSDNGSEEQDLLGITGMGAAAPPEPQEEQKVEETLTPGIDIAAADIPLIDDISQLKLGDGLEITSDRYGAVVGRIYYRDAELIRIMPSGVSNILIDFPIEDGKFDDDLGVTSVDNHVKRHLNTFVEQHSLSKGQLVETFLPNGQPGPKFTIAEVNVGADSVLLREVATEEELPLPFNGVGIPRSVPFIIMRTREAPEPEGNNSSEAVGNEEGVAPITNEELFEEDDIDEDGFATVEVKLVGFVNVPIIAEAEEIAEIARRYPEALQKSDLLSDFISLLSARDQKENRKLQQIRSAVEQYSLLKQAIINYDPQGQPLPRAKPTSYMMMADLLASENVPLQRPVVSIRKRIYIPKDEAESDDFEDNQFIVRDAYATTDAQNDFFPPDEFKRGGSSAASATPSEPLDANFYNNMISYLSKFQSPFEAGSTAGRETFTPLADAEVFRLEPPATSEEDTELKGLHIDCEKTKAGIVCNHSVNKILYSTDRLLSTSYRPTVNGRPKQVFTSSEVVPQTSTILFPPSTAMHLGSKRTRRLWEDIIRSQTPHMTMKQILDKIPIEDVPTGLGILHMGSMESAHEGSTQMIANVPVAHYVDQQPMIGMGPGDFHDQLADLGLREAELNEDLLAVLVEKYQNIEAQIINYLSDARARAAQEPPAPMFDQMLPDTAVTSTIPRDEPLLRVLLDDLMKQSGTWSKVDLGQINSLLRKQKDLYTAVVGGMPATIKKERDIATSRSFLQALSEAKAARKMREDVGEPPKENKCKHVLTLRGIRRHEEPKERAVLLLQFLNQYQGERKDNWINCMVCKEHLLCEHELVQLQMAIHPRETDTLMKKLHLEYAGGLFGAHYVCRVCGQPFSELGYDTHLEFDDEGRPMMGRAVLVDEDALKKEEIELMLGTPVKKDDVITFNNKDLDSLYEIAKQICRRVGIYPDLDGYKRIINPAYAAFKKEPQTEEDFKRILAARAKQQGKPALNISYQMYIAKATLAIVAAYTLLEIQTKVPEYNPRYILPGCDTPGFGGFPLGAKEDLTGIRYISCALAGITSGEDIWEKSKLMNIKDFSKRVDEVSRHVLSNCNKMLADTSALQRMSDKRAWVEKMAREQAQRYPETVRQDFKPAQIYSSTEEAAKVAEKPILVENAGPIHAMVDAWILKAHAVARLRSIIFTNSPYAETFCCEHPLGAPTSFWKDQDMPALPGRGLIPITELGTLRVQDEPRPVAPILADPPSSIFHRLFLNVCYDGVRKGFPHETGFNNVCAWCGFQFPGDPALVDPDVEGLQALQSQGVDLSATSFEDLLDACHMNYKVSPYKIPKLPTPEGRMTAIAALSPAPHPQWEAIIAETSRGLAELGPTATELDVATKLEAISEAASQATQAVQRLLSQRTAREGTQEEYLGILGNIMSQPAEELLEIIEFYFLTASNILLNKLPVNTFQTLSKTLKKIYDSAASKDLAKVMESHYSNVESFANTFIGDDTQLAREKLEHFADQMSALLSLKQYYKPLLLPGTDQTLTYMLKLGFLAPLASLLDSSVMRPGSAAVTAGQALRDVSSRALIDFIKGQFKKYKVENTKYSPAEIQLIIAKLAEKEKDGIIADFERLKKDPARFEVEMLNKRLGLGRWAVGGTSAIRQYNDDHYEFEREERARAGQIDFPGMDSGKQKEYNMFDLMGGGAGPQEEGYDNAQVAEDDY
jgi:hypothetical protein